MFIQLNDSYISMLSLRISTRVYETKRDKVDRLRMSPKLWFEDLMVETLLKTPLMRLGEGF